MSFVFCVCLMGCLLSTVISNQFWTTMSKVLLVLDLPCFNGLFDLLVWRVGLVVGSGWSVDWHSVKVFSDLSMLPPTNSRADGMQDPIWNSLFARLSWIKPASSFRTMDTCYGSNSQYGSSWEIAGHSIAGEDFYSACLAGAGLISESDVLGKCPS